MKVPDYDNTPIVSVIKEKIHSARDRRVLIDRFANDLSYSEICAKYKISLSTVTRIIAKGKNKIFLNKN